MQSMLDIPEFEGTYSATPSGEIFSHRSGRVLRSYLSPNGYLLVTLYREGRPRVRRSVHRLVALAFHGEPTGLVVRHLDGNPLNNNPRNLRYGTYSQNSVDSIIHGTNRNHSKSACIRGHDFTPQNTGVRKDARRYCKRCEADRVLAAYYAKKSTKENI